MYAYIKGKIEHISDDSFIIENNGIGYFIMSSANVIGKLSVHEQTTVYTYLHVREDGVALFGFLTQDEITVFKMLISVSGIGPKGALGILSALSADDLRFAILAGDSKAIAKAPGIGAKTAQRVILELKDKMSLEDAFEKKLEHEHAPVMSSNNQVKNDAVLALTALGYSSTESLKAVSKVDITEDMDVEAVLKLALKNMAFL